MLGPGDPVPTATVDGDRSLAELLGSDPAVIVFFKRDCATCQLALPVYQHWAEQVPVIGIAQDDPDTTAGFFAEFEIQMETVFDGPAYEASSAFDIDGVPALFLVEDGVITASALGWSLETTEEIAERLAELSGTERALVGAGGLPPFQPG